MITILGYHLHKNADGVDWWSKTT